MTMQTMQLQSTAQEPDVRGAIVNALASQGVQVTNDAPGNLVIEIGSVGKAFLAGGFRGTMKMPMRFIVLTVGGPGGTGLTIHVGSRGTGSGFMSGGLLGASKQKKAERAWMQMIIDAVPGKVGGPPTEAQPLPPPPQEQI
jgi:hypothetical protein